MLLQGSLLRPDLTVVVLSSATSLVVTELPEDLVSARTVNFFLAPEDVAVTEDVFTP